MRAQAMLSEEVATPEERESSVHEVGPLKGQFAVTAVTDHRTPPSEYGNHDYAQNYRDALEALLASDPRISQGHAFYITLS